MSRKNPKSRNKKKRGQLHDKMPRTSLQRAICLSKAKSFSANSLYVSIIHKVLSKCQGLVLNYSVKPSNELGDSCRIMQILSKVDKSGSLMPCNQRFIVACVVPMLFASCNCVILLATNDSRKFAENLSSISVSPYIYFIRKAYKTLDLYGKRMIFNKYTQIV